MPMPRCGWKPDLREHIDATPVMGPVMRAERFGISKIGSTRRENRDLLRYCTSRDQRLSSACVGFAATGAAHARLRLLGFETELFSPLVPYGIGRQLEGIYKGIPLPDDGSHPYLVMSGSMRYGFVPEKFWPFDGDYQTRIHQEIPFDIFQKASQFRLSNIARIEVSRSQRGPTCVKALDAGHFIPLGMIVGQEFSDYTKGRGPVGVESGADTGGHMTFLAGYEDYGEVFLVWNSWGADQGDESVVRIHRSKLEHESTTDLYNFGITEQRA